MQKAVQRKQHRRFLAHLVLFGLLHAFLPPIRTSARTQCLAPSIYLDCAIAPTQQQSSVIPHEVVVIQQRLVPKVSGGGQKSPLLLSKLEI